jgi:4'-phosphopantetheinyl transferase
LCFNLSHPQGVALYAIARGREVGIDIERRREDFASLAVAERFFSPDEVTMLKSLAPDLRTSAFFNCWTRKEALIKALGEGLSHPIEPIYCFPPNAQRP